METSAYQLIKIHILDAITLSKDAVHLYIGLGVFLVAVVVWQKRRITWMSLLPVILVAAGMEALDLRDDYRSFGYLRWSASAHDIINTSVWPVIFVLLSKLKLIRVS